MEAARLGHADARKHRHARDRQEPGAHLNLRTGPGSGPCSLLQAGDPGACDSRPQGCGHQQGTAGSKAQEPAPPLSECGLGPRYAVMGSSSRLFATEQKNRQGCDLPVKAEEGDPACPPPLPPPPPLGVRQRLPWGQAGVGSGGRASKRRRNGLP